MRKKTIISDGNGKTISKKIMMFDNITDIKILSNNIAWKIKDYYDAADMFLFDTEGTNFGGTGKKFDWQLLKDININKPFFLSGGIAPEDVENIKAFMQQPTAKDLFSLDINSRFEIAPGKKDIEKVSTFIHSMKS